MSDISTQRSESAAVTAGVLRIGHRSRVDARLGGGRPRRGGERGGS